MNEAIDYLLKNFPYLKEFVVVHEGYIILESTNPKPYESKLSFAIRSSCALLSKALKSPGDIFVQRLNKYGSRLDNLRSSTKSVMAILIGIALQEGYISNIDEKLATFFPEYFRNNKQISKGNITLRHLLTMKSGISSFDQGLSPFKLLFKKGKWLDYCFNLPMCGNPGVKFDYNSANTHILSAIIARVSGKCTIEFAKEYLFNKLGIREVYWEQDAQEINFGGGNLFLNIYDFAKIGFLILNNGAWNSEQIVSTNWIKETLTSRHDWMYGYQYGYLWYIKNEKSDKSGKEYVVYSASGAGGQKILMIPELDIVVAATSAVDLTKDVSYHLDAALGKHIIPAVE